MRGADNSPINAALRAFEAAEANLDKLERIFSKLHTPYGGISFSSDPEYDDLRRAYEDVLAALPTIDGWKPSTMPMDPNVVAQWRLDAREIDELSAIMDVEDTTNEPARELAAYRYRLNKSRRQLVRDALADVIACVDDLLRRLADQYGNVTDFGLQVETPEFEALQQRVQEIDTLLGSSFPRPERWMDLQRHLRFGQIGDLRDITTADWPKIKAGLVGGLYNENEPIPVGIGDLAVLAASRPKGTVATRLRWESLSPEDFERLLFALISSAAGYENPEWLMKTNAPDRGRDLSVARVVNDQLSGVSRSRVIIQCKHWPTKSVGTAEISQLKDQMKLWEPPRVDVLVIATSGRFSEAAVASIEKHNTEDRALRIEMWPESHLERLLAVRPGLIAEFHLR